MSKVISIRLNDKEAASLEAILAKEGIENRNQFLIDRILHKRRMQPVIITPEQRTAAEVYNILNGTIVDYRAGVNILEDLNEVREKLKKIL